MLLKRKIIIALDKYEDEPTEMLAFADEDGKIPTNRDTGIPKDNFINWFLKQETGRGHAQQQIKKCIADCDEDGYLHITSRVIDKNLGGALMPEQYHIRFDEIVVSSQGRDLKKNTHFFFACLNKMGAERLVVESFLILLGAWAGYLLAQ